MGLLCPISHAPSSPRRHPPERRATPLPPGEPPWPGGTQGHLSPATAEEPLATAKPPLGLPEPPRAPLSLRSSGAGSAAAQHWPRKVSPRGLRVPICQHPQTLLQGPGGAQHQSCSPRCICRSSALCHRRQTAALWARRPAGCHPPCTPPSTGPPRHRVRLRVPASPWGWDSGTRAVGSVSGDLGR